jgi:hypothetical protein
VVRRRSRWRTTARRVLGFLAAPLLLLVFGCDHPPKDADRRLDQLTAQKIYQDPPPGTAVLLAEGRDRGLDSTIASRYPSVVRIYKVEQTADAIINHYQQTYPEYGWSTGSYFPAPDQRGADLIGTSGSIYADVYVGEQAYVPGYPAVTPSTAPTWSGTYVTVYLAAHSHG